MADLLRMWYTDWKHIKIYYTRSIKLKKIVCNNELETQALGQKIAGFLKPGDFIGLNGDLGAGKTFYVGPSLKA